MTDTERLKAAADALDRAVAELAQHAPAIVAGFAALAESLKACADRLAAERGLPLTVVMGDSFAGDSPRYVARRIRDEEPS